MKKVLLAIIILVAANVSNAYCQPGIFDPNDVLVNYNPASPPATPPENTIAKWVRTPRVSWNTDKFKAYYYNDMSLRIRFPNGYDPADQTKKYPVILFFHGGGEVAPVTDNEYHLFVGAERFEKMIDAGQFNAFLVYPQQKTLGWDYFYMTKVNNVLDSLEKYCHTDPDRIISMGLSAGGYGAMYFSITFPQRSATTIASSPALIDILNQPKESFIHIPFWLASGGTDANPNPTVVQNFTDSFAAKGGKIRNSFFPMVEHNTWEYQWDQPYLLPAWLTAHKANPLVYFNRTKFISADLITARLGITGGFFEYQWQRNNVDIPGAVTNELNPTQFGTYRVRFKRYSNSPFSDWSPNPVVISQDNIAPSTPQNLTSLFSGRTFVNLDWNNSTDNDSVTQYEVFVNGVKKYTTGESAITADNLVPNTSYTFSVRALDQAGNMSGLSNQEIKYTTSVTNGLHYRYYEGLWEELPNFNALTPVKTGVSPNVDVNQKAPDKVDLYAFVWEGYINITTPGTYTFETNSDDGSKIYFNSFYSPTTKSLVNNDGSHGPWSRSGTVNIPTAGLYPIAITYFEMWNSETMEVYWTGPNFARSIIPDSVFLDTNIAPLDNIAPGIPANVKMVNAGVSFIDIDWDNSPDNVGVTSYDVYVDNVKKYSSPVSNVTLNYLTPGSTHTVKIKALDQAGNASAFSTEISVTTSTTMAGGLKYRFFQGTWSTLPSFNTLTPVKTGTSPNVDIHVRTPGVDDDYAFIWEGNIHITTPGTYTFETISDDGSKLYFNTFYSASSLALVNNDGLHANQSVTGTVTIPTAGYYPIAITFFERNGGEIMEVYWTGPGIPRQLIPNSAFVETVSIDSPLPTVPGNLNVQNTGNTFVELDWDNSSGNNGISGYDVYVNGVRKYTSPESGITADSLLPNTTYTISVKAVDQLNNVSAASNEVTVTTQDRSNGLKYRYYEGNWNVLPNFNALTPVKAGTSANIDIVTPRLRSDSFAFVWEGYINIPRAGTYTFETMSDDGSMLYFNSFYSPRATPLINSDGAHAFQSVAGTVVIPAPGLYPIAITYFDKYYDEAMQVYWTGPEIPRQLIPSVAFTNPAGDLLAPDAPANLRMVYKSRTYVNLDWDDAGDNVGVTSYDIYVNNVKKYTTHESAITADKLLSNTSYTFTVKALDQGGNVSAASAPVTAATTTTVTGLNYRYYEGNWDSLPNFNALTPVKSGASANIDLSVRTAGVDDYFAFVWEGYFNFQSPGNYTFELMSDDGSKLYFNSFYSPSATPIINNDGLHGATNVSATVNITAAGLYPMSAVFFEKLGGEVMELFISGPGIPRQRVPNSAFIGLNPATPTRNESAVTLNTANATIDIAGEQAGRKVPKAYPNPVTEWLNVDYYVETSKSDIGVDIVDMNGKMVYRNNFKSLPAGSNTLKMNISNGKLTPGVYFVKINVNGVPSTVIKLVKSRK